MELKDKFKKCPFCELNYIKADEECCKVCYEQNPQAKRMVKIKEEIDFNKEQERRLNKEKEDRKTLLEVMRAKGFIGFVRTENFDNFVKIYNSGYLMSRQTVQRENINFTDNADPNVILNTSDFVKKHVRFYYRCKTPTNYGAYYYFGQKNPIMLVFDEELIFDKNAIFCDGNAMAGQTRQIRKADFALKNFNWDDIFSFGQFNADDLAKKNHRNAEFLLPDKVSLEYVKNIYFKNRDDMKNAIALLGNDKRFEHKPEMFF